MASHAAAGDPRVRPSLSDPRQKTSKEDEIRKRVASRSPAGGAQPVIKKPNQSGPTAPSANGNHGRKSSININDARPDPRSSLAKSTGQSAPLTHGNNVRQSSVNVNDPRRSHANSPADSRRNSISVNSNVINGNPASSKQLNPQNGLTSPNGTMGGSGGSTPQSSTAPVANMSSGAPPSTQTSNTPSSLHASISNALLAISDQAVELTNSRNEFTAADVALQKAQREYNSTYSWHASFAPTKEQKTTAKALAQVRYDQAHRALQQANLNQQQVVNAAATAIADMQIAPVAPVARAADPGLKGQVMQAMSAVSTAETKLSAVEDKLVTLSKRVENVSARVPELESKVLQHTLASTDAAELQELKERVDGLEECQDRLDDLLRTSVEAQVAEAFQAVRSEIQALEANVTEANSIQHTNAQTIDECLSRLEGLRAEIEQNGPQNATGEALADLQQSVANITDELTSMQSSMQPTTTQAAPAPAADPSIIGVPFKPIYPDDTPLQEAHVSTAVLLSPRPDVNTTWNDWIEQHIGSLQMRVDNHQMRLDNMTTDDIYQNMTKVVVDKYHNEYPSLKNWAGTVNEIKATHDRDVGQLRTDVTAISSRVENHEDFVLQGQQKFNQIDSEYKAMSEEVLQLQGAQQKALERAFDNATS